MDSHSKPNVLLQFLSQGEGGIKEGCAPQQKYLCKHGVTHFKKPMLLENLNKDSINHDLSPDLLFPPLLNTFASFSKHPGQKPENNSEMRIKVLLNQGEMKISNIPF